MKTEKILHIIRPEFKKVSPCFMWTKVLSFSKCIEYYPNFFPKLAHLGRPAITFSNMDSISLRYSYQSSNFVLRGVVDTWE